MSWKQVKKNKAKQKEYIKSLEGQRDRLWEENNDLKAFVQNLIDGLHMINDLAAALGHGEVAVIIEKGQDGRNKFVAVEADHTDDEKEDDGQRDGN